MYHGLHVWRSSPGGVAAHRPAIARGPPQSTHHVTGGRGAILAWPAGHRMLCHCHSSRTNVRTSRISWPCCQSFVNTPWSGYRIQQETSSSFNRFFGFQFRLWKKFEFNIPSSAYGNWELTGSLLGHTMHVARHCTAPLHCGWADYSVTGSAGCN